ncbi:hypothetical protein AYO44_06385 [Planctomycetaceae bacterium SCGC AG-212-F19]|nr:hypothetical protein AYO44_06385 [Planctomycetaceae bacterium SCGC AG-212-F19]
MQGAVGVQISHAAYHNLPCAFHPGVGFQPTIMDCGDTDVKLGRYAGVFQPGLHNQRFAQAGRLNKTMATGDLNGPDDPLGRAFVPFFQTGYRHCAGEAPTDRPKTNQSKS